MPQTEELCARILGRRDRVFELQKALTAIPALGPENGGQGEFAKAVFVENCLKQSGATDIFRVDSPDARVESGLRPNLIATIPGRSQKALWIFGHLDVVPPGDPSAWSCDPWQAVEKDGMIFGRGVEDNQQAVCSMLILAESLKELAIVPELSLRLVFMADEELGSAHGLKWILKTRPELFKKNDLYIVPDGGSPDATLIEIAEKAQLWLKFTVVGRQCHASAPDCGLNSFLAASKLALALNGLNGIFNAQNPLFEPPRSTFTPTKHDANVDAVNILPGKDVFYMDCRLLPGLSSDSVLAGCRELCAAVAAETGSGIEVEIAHCRAASETSPDAPVVTSLKKAVKAVYKVDAQCRGIGGATVAAFLRDEGLAAVVWACIENTCHQPDERSSITATLKDAAVFAHILEDAPRA